MFEFFKKPFRSPYDEGMRVMPTEAMPEEAQPTEEPGGQSIELPHQELNEYFSDPKKLFVQNQAEGKMQKTLAEPIADWISSGFDYFAANHPEHPLLSENELTELVRAFRKIGGGLGNIIGKGPDYEQFRAAINDHEQALKKLLTQAQDLIEGEDVSGNPGRNYTSGSLLDGEAVDLQPGDDLKERLIRANRSTVLASDFFQQLIPLIPEGVGQGEGSPLPDYQVTSVQPQPEEMPEVPTDAAELPAAEKLELSSDKERLQSLLDLAQEELGMPPSEFWRLVGTQSPQE